MKTLLYVGAIVVVGLSGCEKPSENAAGPVAHGRYVGVGIYQAGSMWSQMVVAKAPKDPASATIKDDEQVIVVVDSNTGELRQCGNLTGYCVGMNPWANPLASPQLAPITVTKHAEELSKEQAATAKDNEVAPAAH